MKQYKADKKDGKLFYKVFIQKNSAKIIISTVFYENFIFLE